jgi:hypothetical protein
MFQNATTSGHETLVLRGEESRPFIEVQLFICAMGFAIIYVVILQKLNIVERNTKAGEPLL